MENESVKLRPWVLILEENPVKGFSEACGCLTQMTDDLFQSRVDQTNKQAIKQIAPFAM